MTEPLSPRDLFERFEAGALKNDALGGESAEVKASAELVRRYFDMWNTGEGAVADQVLAPHYLDHAYPAVIGPAAARAIAPRFRRANPEARMTPQIVGADGEYVAVRNRIRKVHDGQAVEVEATALFRIGEGRIVELWSWWPGAKPMHGWPKSTPPTSRVM